MGVACPLSVGATKHSLVHQVNWSSFILGSQIGGYKVPFLSMGGAVLVLVIPSIALVWRISKFYS